MRCLFAWLLATVVIAAGCRSITPKSIELQDVTPVRAQRQEQALQQFEEDRSEAQFKAAQSHWEQGHLEDCERLLANILARQPEHVPAALLLAEVKLAGGQPDQAGDCLQRALGSGPQSSDAHLCASVLALRYNQPRLAIDLLEADPSAEPASAAALRTLGVAYYRCGDYAAAEASLQRALALDNTSALAYFLIGCTQSRLGRSSEAEAALEQAARLDTRFRAASARSG
jgi:tetratricopeptide (TPR) repeat protein